jgi:hypothetical protein
MAGRNVRALLAATGREAASEVQTGRVVLGRVRPGSLMRVAFKIGWFASLAPSLIASMILVWVLHGTWSTLHGWDPWTPWAPDTRILGAPLPTPEFKPRESLHVEGLYRALGPFGQHPFFAVILCTLLFTVFGGLFCAVWVVSIGLTYNRFIGSLGGIEFELIERPARGTPSARRSRGEKPEDWEDAKLRW